MKNLTCYLHDRCAGLCCYEGRGGLCSIRLSAPLLKLRPRKDLVQTLLVIIIAFYSLILQAAF